MKSKASTIKSDTSAKSPPKSKTNTNISLDKIKITFDFNNEKLSLDAEPYKTLKKLKEKAVSNFFQCPKNAKCYYLNKDITDSEAQQIGLLFPGKKNVDIKLKENKEVKETKSTDNASNKNPTSLTSSIAKDKKDKSDILDDESYKKLINEIKPKKGKNDDKFYCDCNKNQVIIEYCRNCNKFLCEVCSKDKAHLSHNTINVKINSLEESLKKYQEIIMEELNAKKAYTMKITSKAVNNTTKDNKAVNKDITKKLNTIYENYEKITNLIEQKKKSNEITKTEIDKYLNEYNTNYLTIKNDLEYTLSNFKENNASNATFGLSDFKHYFDSINLVEGKYGANNNTNLFFLAAELEYKIYDMNKKISRAIEEVMQSKIIDKINKELNNK